MKQAIVGTYEFGYENVQLVLREGIGGEFYVLPGDINYPRIKIGADQAHWKALVTVLLHETMEFAYTRIGARYAPSEELGRDHAAYFFILTHPQLSESCGRAADFLANCLPDLDQAWRQWNRSQNKKKKSP